MSILCVLIITDDLLDILDPVYEEVKARGEPPRILIMFAAQEKIEVEARL